MLHALQWWFGHKGYHAPLSSKEEQRVGASICIPDSLPGSVNILISSSIVVVVIAVVVVVDTE